MATALATRRAAKAPAKAGPKKRIAAAAAARKAPVRETRGKGKLPKFSITVDERTLDMTMEALLCRESGHHWNRVPQGAARRSLLAHRGQAETVRLCSTCSSQRIELYWLPSFETAAPTRYVWSEGYLIAKAFQGSGRLSRTEVRKALFTRDNLDLVA